MACGEPAPSVDRNHDVSALSFADVQQRALRAVTRADMIFHLTETRSGSQNDPAREIWVDADRRLARTQQDGGLSVFNADQVAVLDLEGRYREALYSFDGLGDPLIGFTLKYLARLLTSDVQDPEVAEAIVNGSPAIRVRVRQEVNNDGNRSTETARVYLDESFLPLKMELDRKGRTDDNSVYRSEYVSRDSVPADFFSFEHVRAIARNYTDIMREPAQSFGATYWLGDPFEDMIIERVGSGASDGDEPSLSISYGGENPGAGGLYAPFPCAQISEYTAAGWDERKDRVRENNPYFAQRVLRDTRRVLGGETRVFEWPVFQGISWTAEVSLPDRVVEISVNCGPPGKNRHNSLEGIQHLVDSLRLFEGG